MERECEREKGAHLVMAAAATGEKKRVRGGERERERTSGGERTGGDGRE